MAMTELSKRQARQKLIGQVNELEKADAITEIDNISDSIENIPELNDIIIPIKEIIGEELTAEEEQIVEKRKREKVQKKTGG